MSDEEWLAFLKKSRRRSSILVAINLAFVVWGAASRFWVGFGLNLIALLVGVYALGEIEESLDLWQLICAQRNLIKEMLRSKTFAGR